MQQPRPEDLQCYSKAISTQNESISLSANIIRKYLALTQHFLSMNLKAFYKSWKYVFGLIYREENTGWNRNRFALSDKTI